MTINADKISLGSYEIKDFKLKSLTSNDINDIKIRFYNKDKEQSLNLYRFFDEQNNDLIIRFRPSFLVIDNKKWHLNEQDYSKDNLYI